MSTSIPIDGSNEESHKYGNKVTEILSVQSSDSHYQRENCAYSATATTVIFLAIINVAEDGNCFFTSVALELSYFSIQQLGLNLSAPITELMMKLREVIVDEWMSCRMHVYKEFLADSSQFELYANLFR